MQFHMLYIKYNLVNKWIRLHIFLSRFIFLYIELFYGDFFTIVKIEQDLSKPLGHFTRHETKIFPIVDIRSILNTEYAKLESMSLGYSSSAAKSEDTSNITHYKGGIKWLEWPKPNLARNYTFARFFPQRTSVNFRMSKPFI